MKTKPFYSSLIIAIMIFLIFICINSESGDYKEIDLPKLNFENGENRTEYFPFKKVSCIISYLMRASLLSITP